MSSRTGPGGNDTYSVDSTADVVNEDPNAAVGGSNDRVLTTVSYTLKAGSGIETLQTTDSTLTTALSLTGNALANTVIGNAGDNVLNGGAGKDTLFGLGGADAFLFNTALNTAPGAAFGALPATANVDFIGEYAPAADTIQLEDAIFIALGTTPAGPGGVRVLVAGAFNTGASATQADDRIIYNTTTGALIYDADGSGAGAAFAFAVVNPALALSNADFVVV